MDFKKFIENIHKSLKYTKGFSDAVKRLLWLYKIGGDRIINFRFNHPLTSIRLFVRNNYGADVFIVSEVFEMLHYDIPYKIKPKSIVDLGANAGFSTIYFAKKYPEAKIFSVEPIENNIVAFKKNLELNEIENVTLYKAAISVESGFLEMILSDKDYGHKVSDIEYGRDFNGKKITVSAITMEQIMIENKLEIIDILKVDIEGYEGLLLKKNCNWLKKVRCLIIELHEGLDEEDLIEISSKYDFELPIKPKGLHIIVNKNYHPLLNLPNIK